MATQPAAGGAQADPTRIDPKHYNIETENEKVRVVRARYGPREKSVMHAHPALIGVMLTDGHIRMSYPDGRTEEIHTKAGDVINFPAVVHQPENLGNQPFEAVLVELKS